jgi:hypothetical protein
MSHPCPTYDPTDYAEEVAEVRHEHRFRLTKPDHVHKRFADLSIEEYYISIESEAGKPTYYFICKCGKRTVSFTRNPKGI